MTTTTMSTTETALDEEVKTNIRKQETEINYLKLQLSDLSSQLQASKHKEKALNLNNANNGDSIALDDEEKMNLQKQEKEINQLKLQLLDHSSQYQAVSLFLLGDMQFIWKTAGTALPNHYFLTTQYQVSNEKEKALLV